MENKKPLISVIMSVYNEEAYIKEALESILNQTEQDFEILIVDDCSTDRTVSIIEGMKDDRIFIIKNEVNQGLTKNLNLGLRLARGKYIARMDGDDISLPQRFEKQVRYLEEHPQVMLISCQTMTFGAKKMVWRLKDDSARLKAMMLIRPVFAHPGFMIRSELIRKYGISYDERYRSGQDYHFAMRTSVWFQIGMVEEVLLKYRAHDKQISSQKGEEQFENADRVRKLQLQSLGLQFDEQEWDTLRSWAIEEKSANIKKLFRAKKMIKKFLIANREKKIYPEETLERVLKEQLYLWAIRTKSLKSIFRAAALCGLWPENIGILLGQIWDVFTGKIYRLVKCR